MNYIDYNIPIFDDDDEADLNKYSNKMAQAIKEQVDKFGNPLIFKGTVSTIQNFPDNAQPGWIYNVTSENKNYIFNGEDWFVYSENFDVSNLATQDEFNIVEEYDNYLKDNILSNNLFDGEIIIDKSHNSIAIIHTIGTSTNKNTIPVIAGKQITFKNNNGPMPCVVLFYKADMTHILNTNTYTQETVTVPDEGAYMDFNISTTDLGNNPKIMINYGTEAMEYQAYANVKEDLKRQNNIMTLAKDENPDTTLQSLILTNINTPETNINYYIQTFFSLSKGERTQIAYGYNNDKVWIRNLYSNEWSEWKLVSNEVISTNISRKTGRIIDGKEEYIKKIDLGSLPNNTIKNVTTNLSNIKITNFYGVARSETGQRKLPFSTTSGLCLDIYFNQQGSTITIASNYDFSVYTEAELYFCYVMES